MFISFEENVITQKKRRVFPELFNVRSALI